MSHEIIERYINDILNHYLTAIGTSDVFIKTVNTTIRNQMLSCISYWDIEEFRKAILVIGSEEGLFYEPYADNDIRNFVVVTIRNSELEWLQTNNFALAGLNKEISDAHVQPLTSTAIKYFKDVDFNALAKQIEMPDNNIYGTLSKKYPMAFQALTALANNDRQYFYYDKPEQPSSVNLDLVPLETNTVIKYAQGDRSTLNHVEADGISFTLDSQLREILEHIAENNKIPFVCDSFKSVTRNTEKMLLIMEYVLSHGGVFVTSNYFIMNDYIEQRTNKIRAGHNRHSMMRNWLNMDGLADNHQYALKWASDGLKCTF